jgi:hypothetical protein
MSLKGKVALVTGSSRGIGRASRSVSAEMVLRSSSTTPDGPSRPGTSSPLSSEPVAKPSRFRRM